jgi:uncharacterized SAM-binding protein YcdF (DUF218 family)
VPIELRIPESPNQERAEHNVSKRMIKLASTARNAALKTVPRSNSALKRWGIFTRKECWRLSWRGWLILALFACSGAVLLLFNVQSFLAVTNRGSTNVLIVEGWIHDYALRAAVAEFRDGSYQRVFTTGGPVEGSGGYINDYHTNASVGANLLKKYGLPDESLQMVPSRAIDHDRTYGSAVALRNWFREHDIHIRSLNVLTENVHARRSRLLFSKALGPEISVGIIAVPNPDYDARRWWRYSEGVKDVGSEAIAYIYARFLFHRWGPQDRNKAAVASQSDTRQ